RAAHSIKGGAATFGFVALTETTHLLENLLDSIRRGDMALRADMIDIFLETKDVLNGQLDTYRQDAEPAPASYEHICAVLKQLAAEHRGEIVTAAANASPVPSAEPAPVAAAAPAAPPVAADPPAPGTTRLLVTLTGVADKD